MPHGHLGDRIGLSIQWLHRFLCIHPLDSFVNLSIDWPINTLKIENLTFHKYEVAVLYRVISILEIILLAAGWLMQVAVLCKDNIK